MTTIGPVEAVIFDAYGTLFDIHAPTARAAAAIGDPKQADALGRLWRDKQLQYSWLRSLMGVYTDFWIVTQDALDYALEAMGINDPALKNTLLDLYFKVDAYPDAISALEALKAKGLKTAILSNGSRDMLDAAVTSSGASTHLDQVLSVADVRIFKPDGAVYTLAETAFGLPAARMAFVSCNGWDAWGSAHYGFQTVWLNRFALPKERLPGEPKAIITGLDQLPELLSG
ncbi:MAG: haloacid dehalogenase type II [Pseudomonadota bacterium]